jgi:hypothetical protein
VSSLLAHVHGPRGDGSLRSVGCTRWSLNTDRSAYPVGTCDNAVMMISITTITDVEEGPLPDTGVKRGAGRGSSRVAHRNRKCNWKRDRPVQCVSGGQGASCSPVEDSGFGAYTLLHASSALCSPLCDVSLGTTRRGEGLRYTQVDGNKP